MAKFLFENSFNEDDLRSTYDHKAMEEIKLQSFEEGRTQGKQEALEEIENHLKLISGELESQLTALLASEASVRETIHLTALEVGKAITEVVIPTLAQKGAWEEIEAVVKKALASFSESTPIELKVHPDLQEPTKEYITSMGEALASRVTVSADGECQISDCKVESVLGGIERITATIWEDVNKTLQSYHPEIENKRNTTVEHEGDEL